MKKAVILFNLGGPDSQESVEPFLFNLFYDPEILSLPKILRYPMAKIISKKRKPTAQKIYSEIGGSSPILKLTNDQSKALENKLNENINKDIYKCFVVMRCWHPRASQVVNLVKDYNADEIILLPLYPQYSSATSGSSIKEWLEVSKKNKINKPTKIICCYPTDDNFIIAHTKLIKETIQNLNSYKLIFSAHGLPERNIKKGEFTKLLENIYSFNSVESNCVLGCSFIVGNSNYKEIFNVCKELKSAGVDHVKISGVIVGNTSQENKSYHNNIRKVVSEQIDKSSKLSDSNYTIIDHYHDLDDRFEKDYDICPFILYRPVIGADCNVYTCQDKAYTVSGKLGNITDVSFKDFWMSEDNRQSIYNVNPSIICNHHCISHSKNGVINELLNIDQDHLPFT